MFDSLITKKSNPRIQMKYSALVVIIILVSLKMLIFFTIIVLPGTNTAELSG